eukprot:6213244-Pleurochrysis_carterae.AAC.1
MHYPTCPTISPEMRKVLLEQVRAAQVAVQRMEMHGKAVEASAATSTGALLVIRHTFKPGHFSV